MKILIVNKFLYPRGGDCVCTLNLGKLLVRKGHEVRFFAMNYTDNLSFEESIFFPDEISFAESGIVPQLKATMRILFGKGVEKCYKKMLDEFKPDIIHLNNIHSYISPVVAKIAYEYGIRVVWTLHDYKLICPAYSCLYHGNICEACFANKKNVFVKRCMKNSLLASILAYMEITYWNKKKICKWTDKFICPSQFMADKMIRGQFPKAKMNILCNFITDEKIELIRSIKKERKQTYCYIGRLSEEKGIKELLSVATKLPYKLFVVGTGPLADSLIKEYSSNENIRFLGHLNFCDIVKLLKEVTFSVIPSIWYENNPLSAIESLCCGTPVLGADIGGIPELLTDEYSKLFFVRDLEDLNLKIVEMFETCSNINNNKLSEQSFTRFSEEKHYSQLIQNIYNFNTH